MSRCRIAQLFKRRTTGAAGQRDGATIAVDPIYSCRPQETDPRASSASDSIYREAAKQGKSHAQYFLGRIYIYGAEGVAKNPPEGLQLLKLAAAQNHVGAQRSLGPRYALGQGVAQSDEQASYWYRKAAEQGEPFSMYYTGTTMETNYVMRLELEAIDFLRKAANHQIREATWPLAARLIYFGVTMDFARTGGTRGTKEQGLPYLMEGHMWLRIAALRPGNIESDHVPIKQMTNLPDTLTPAQRAEIERRVQEWLTNHPEKKP